MNDLEFNLEQRTDLLLVQEIFDILIKKRGVARIISGAWIPDNNVDQGEIKYEGKGILVRFAYALVGNIYECKLNLKVPNDNYSIIINTLKQRFFVKPQPAYSR